MLASALASLFALAPLAIAKPRRIVSLNLCTDQLLLMLAERPNIASVTAFAARPDFSALVGQAKGLHVNHGQVEEILPLKPDLVLSGRFSARATVGLLRKLGYKVVVFPVANTMDGVRDNIRRAAAAFGEPARGLELLRRFDAQLAALRPPQPTAPGARRPVAAFYWSRGYSSGEGTLADAVVAAAGFDNLARRLGLRGATRLPLEVFLTQRADLIVMAGLSGRTPSLAAEVLKHPALARVLARTPSVTVPGHLWICGAPSITEAVARLAGARERLRARGVPAGRQP